MVILSLLGVEIKTADSIDVKLLTGISVVSEDFVGLLSKVDVARGLCFVDLGVVVFVVEVVVNVVVGFVLVFVLVLDLTLVVLAVVSSMVVVCANLDVVVLVSVSISGVVVSTDDDDTIGDVAVIDCVFAVV